ncbi:UDP-N-acetylmuramoyl-L-alanine--D-glutamate ligase [Comamonas sp. NLF-1-9]|uniref:UDP-N-acetylmuramoyl-L-alanine--D-glutamate ligase n=1 Tax=Comamonas sp. NLF-1-9 TaxID=2853163 RepID=UPI001C455AEF|nr:UDP-N-acetylmuramoyl-L-alanine--D-glutamate ligase [Comamonas sp. NLF-1-9]QXL83466.1 UDP-N-acetylmuramoyl-L-alanine--D-glutamate ligase [Comamonas sp. NLF-1-9]
MNEPLHPVNPALADAPPSRAAEAAEFVARLFDQVQQGGAAPEPAPSAEPGLAAAAPAIQAEPITVGDDWQPLAGQRVLVLGLGESGLAMARWCAARGAQVAVADTRAAPPHLAELQAELPQVPFTGGAFTPALVQGITVLARSPGLRPAEIAELTRAAREAGARVAGELDLYADALRLLNARFGYAPAVLAVTGTNGKTTVTALTGKLVAQAGRSVAVAGNIGPSLLDTLQQHLRAASLPEVWVLELSSFQLDGVQGFEPTAATVLNLSQDHLDWHASMQAYAEAKARIFGTQALMVLNRDDPLVMQMLPAPVPVKLRKPWQRPHVSFGTDLPRAPGDFGMESASGMLWLVHALNGEDAGRRDAGAQALSLQRLMPVDALRIHGRHNASNALAALALAQAAGCPLGPLLQALRAYRGEPHRVESVAVVDGVEYFDDSKGTNVGATVAALAGLGADRRLVVILGGDGKGQDFSPLAPPVARHARAVVLIGRDGPRVAQALASCGVPLIEAATLEQAVVQAARAAHSGDAVLLSPACASLDMFEDYRHRARVFVAAVQELAQAGGLAAAGGGA